MSKDQPARALPEGSLGSLSAELSSLKDQVEHLVDSTSSALPKETVAEWSSVLQRLGQAVQAMEHLTSADKHLTSNSYALKSDRVMGVAFAAGSIPVNLSRSWTRASLGWVFGAGLLLGLLLRRK